MLCGRLFTFLRLSGRLCKQANRVLAAIIYTCLLSNYCNFVCSFEISGAKSRHSHSTESSSGDGRRDHNAGPHALAYFVLPCFSSAVVESDFHSKVRSSVVIRPSQTSGLRLVLVSFLSLSSFQLLSCFHFVLMLTLSNEVISYCAC